MNLDSLVVVNNGAESRFEARVDDQLAMLEYSLTVDTIIFTHTAVPPAFRGQGIAGRITRIALEYAQENGLRVIPCCSYTAAYLGRHPEFQALTGES